MKNRNTAVSTVLLRIFAVCFAAAFFWTLMLAIVQSAQSNYYLPIALAPPLLFALLFVWRKCRALYRRILGAVLTRVFLCACAVSLFLMLYLSYRLRLTYDVDTWDFSRLHIDAFRRASGEGAVNISYYAKYKNNQLLLLILSLLARIVLWMAPNAGPEVFHQCAMALNCAAIVSAAVLCFFTVKRARGTHFAFLCGCFLLFYTPLWLYSPIYYTDTLGLPLIVLPVFLYTHLRSDRPIRNILLFCLMGLIAAVGMKLKASIVFVFLAIGIAVLLFDRFRGKWLSVLCGTAVLILAVLLLQARIDRRLHLTSEDYDKWQFPYTHWIMMSLGSSGGYDADLVKYTGSFETLDERKEAVAEKTIELLKERGFAGTVKHLFVTKMQHAWGNGTLSATYYLCREPTENGIFQRFLTQKGASFRYCYYWLQTGHLLLLFCVMLSGLHLFRKPEGGVVTIANIAVFGLVLFLLFWECNARYLVHIAPFLIIGASDGIAALAEKVVAQEQTDRKLIAVLHGSSVTMKNGCNGADNRSNVLRPKA